MKNLFKSMMLVAVAAMAFTACQKDNGELNTLTKKTIINGVATIENDNTRSGFVGTETIENEDGSTTTYYKSAWDGGENIKLFINYGVAEATATVDAEGKFTVELDGDYSESCYITACSPAEAWSSEYSFTIPAEQTPRTESVDPAAHILKAQAITVTNGAANFKMQHEVSYGKMTVNTPEDFKIAKVVINLKGAWYGTDKDLTYTLNATNVKNNTFWFATDTIEVSEMTVTAYDAEDNTYTKTVTMNENKVLKFQYYKVSTFSVSNLEEYVAPAAPAFMYASADGTSGDTTVTFTSAELGTLKLNTFYCFSNSTWPIGTYTFGISRGNIYEGSYSTYAGTNLYHGEVVVSVKNGVYHIEFKNLSDNYSNVVLERATYTGHISPLDVPDTRTKLDMPNVTSSISGKSITLSWDKVENAESYLIESNFMDPISTTETTVTVDVPNYETREFTVQAVVSEDDANYRSSDKAYVYYSDPRTQLAAPSNIVATVDGPSVTISWDKVENAAKYELYYSLNGNQTVTTEERSYTFEAGYNVSNLYVYVTALAAENDEEYRSSVEESVIVNTGKDPNKLADYIWDETFKWDSDSFKLTDDDYVGAYWRIYLNEADRPGNKSIKECTYTCAVNNTNPAQGQFCIKIYGAWSLDNIYASNTYANDTLEVKVVDGQYQIVYTHDGISHGYKGMPDGFELPSEGGDDNTGEGGDNETSIDLTGYTKCNLYSIEEGAHLGTYYDFIAKINLWDASTYDEVSISLSAMNYGTSVEGKTIATGDYKFESNTNNYTFIMEAYDFYCFGTNYSAYTTGTVKVYNDNGTYTILLDLSVNGTPIKYYYQGTL